MWIGCMTVDAFWMQALAAFILPSMALSGVWCWRWGWGSGLYICCSVSLKERDSIKPFETTFPFCGPCFQVMGVWKPGLRLTSWNHVREKCFEIRELWLAWPVTTRPSVLSLLRSSFWKAAALWRGGFEGLDFARFFYLVVWLFEKHISGVKSFVHWVKLQCSELPLPFQTPCCPTFKQGHGEFWYKRREGSIWTPLGRCPLCFDPKRCTLGLWSTKHFSDAPPYLSSLSQIPFNFLSTREEQRYSLNRVIHCHKNENVPYFHAVIHHGFAEDSEIDLVLAGTPRRHTVGPGHWTCISVGVWSGQGKVPSSTRR